MPIRLSKGVKALLLGSFLAFVIQQVGDQFLGTHLMSYFALTPRAVFYQHWIWQIFTASFMHYDVMHLFFDLLMLAFIGSELEFAWGTARFLKYYFFCTISAALLYLGMGAIFSSSLALSPMLGASSGIYALLLAYGLIFGERILLFMMLFPMKAKHFVWVLALVELMTTIFSGAGKSSIAQLGGMVCGFFYLWVQATLLRSRRNRTTSAGLQGFLSRWKKRKSKHLKLVVNNDRGFDSDEESRNKPKTWH